MRGKTRIAILVAGAALPAVANAAETVAYQYDGVGRLVRVERSGGPSGPAITDYAYDKADNRTQMTVSAPNGPVAVGGGFELPDVGDGYAYRPGGGPATFAGNSGIAGNGSAWGFEAAPEGDQVAFVQGGEVPATISLPVAGLTPGTAYQVSFRISQRPGYWSLPVALSFDGAAIGTFDPPTTSFTVATSAPFTASASTGTLSFTASGSAYWAIGLDRVTLAPAGSN